MTHEETPRQSYRLKEIPAVSGVMPDGAVYELVYDPNERTTAFAVYRGGVLSLEQSLTLDSGETLVPFSPENNLIKHEAVLLPSLPSEYVSQTTLVSDIRSFVHRYLDLSETFEKLASCYVLLTWLYDAFNEVPYLRLRGDYGTGKTRGLLVLGSLCYKPFFASGASTVSPLFHTLDAFRGTLILDEADFRFSDEKAEIVKILNNGNVSGLPVLRTMMNRKKEFDPRAFQVFGPKIVATRGAYDDRALESRFLTEEMGKRRLRDDVPINLPSAYKDEARSLRNRLLLYRFRNLAKVSLDESLIDRSFEARLNQITAPLLSIVEDEKLRDDFRSVIAAHQDDLIAARGHSTEAQLLEVLHELLSAAEGQPLPIADIASRFAELHGADYLRPITPKWIGYLLRTRLHLRTLKSHGTYVLPASELSTLDVLFARYRIGGDRGTAARAG